MSSPAMHHASSTTRQYATFHVSDLFFGVEVVKVQEVLCAQQMTRVPLAPEVIRGLINLRGQIVTAVDMRRRLQLPPAPDGREPMNVVLRAEEGAVSLLVDDIGDVLEVPAADFEVPPPNLSPPQRHLIQGVYKLEDRLLLVLASERVLDLAKT
ncbi:MAG: chemotaxis protein CheW [Acidobacteriota bacterium]